MIESSNLEIKRQTKKVKERTFY